MAQHTSSVNHRISSRTNAQTSRPGWRPAQTSHAKLVRDIVTSIQAKRAAGKTADATDYTSDLPTIAAIEALLTPATTLRHEQPEAAQVLRRQPQAAMDSGKTTPTPDWARPCNACHEPTTHGLLCSDCEDMRWATHYDDMAEEFEYMMQFVA